MGLIPVNWPNNFANSEVEEVYCSREATYSKPLGTIGASIKNE